MSKTEVLYKDIAPAAENDASVATNGAASFSVVSNLPHGVPSVAVASCEPNCWGLNGAYQIVDAASIAFWSTEMSGTDRLFVNQPVITVTFSQQHSSLGITLAFDTAGGGYCDSLNIKWYQGATLKADRDYVANSANYFCSQKVTSFDKVVITLKSTNLPNRYAKLEHIIFGIYRYFGMSEIRNASITNQMNLIASELPISTMGWTLDSRDDVEYMFQLKQPVEVRNDNNLIGVYYIDQYRRSAGHIYEIDCYDAFGVLDESGFSGGVYTAKSAKALLEEIIGGYFEMECQVADVTLSGVIQPCTRREAAQQALFAWGACASTDGRESIRVFSLNNTLKEIGRGRTYSGVAVETSAIVTEVRVIAHTYTQDSNGGVEIGGVKYSDAETIYTVANPDVTATDKQNVIEVTGATLVSPGIGQATAQRVYNYYQKRNTNKAKVVWAGELLGDYVSLPNAWGGVNSGHIEKMEIKLSNTVAADSETVGV